MISRVQFKPNQSLPAFQDVIASVYGVPDDRLYSMWDLVSHQQRFAMRALKGMRKKDAGKLKSNLLISFAWLMAVANRLRIDLEEEIWARFPNSCSYCAKRPCACRSLHLKRRRTPSTMQAKDRPKTLAGYQRMFAAIYPTEKRTLAEAGVHLAEEVGEINEALHSYLGQHQPKQFQAIGEELADFASCLFGVANSADIDVAGGLAAMFKNNCHVCHKVPCTCSFGFVASLKT